MQAIFENKDERSNSGGANLVDIICYDSKPKGLSNETTLVLSNTRKLDRVPSTKQSTLNTITHGLCSLLCTLL